MDIITERIKRKIESDMCITPRSTPVIWFGNYKQAKACTISLNPSDIEFYRHPPKQDDYVCPENLLSGITERPCSRNKLNREDNEELIDNEINEVINYCNDYFDRNPYRGWFDYLEHFINHFAGYSYYDGSCVALDLVQWATSPKWSDVPDSIKYKHLRNDLPVLKHLLDKDFEIIFLNGKTVVEEVSEKLKIYLKCKSASFINKKEKLKNVDVYSGKYKDILVIGWNLYLQSAHVGSYENIDILCDTIKSTVVKGGIY